MAATAPIRNEMLPIDDNDHTMEIDTRWMLADRAEQKTQMESDDSDVVYDSSADYKKPTLGSELSATQVIDLLNLGK